MVGDLLLQLRQYAILQKQQNIFQKQLLQKKTSISYICNLGASAFTWV